MIVNLDKILFSNTTRANYSWDQKGEAAKVNNIVFHGSISIIAAISS